MPTVKRYMRIYKILLKSENIIFLGKFEINIPIVRIKQLSHYASTAKVAALGRMNHLKKPAVV